MTVPLFSIVIPVHDRAGTLPRCLASVLAQSFEDFEIVAVDDGSTDGSRACLEQVADARLRVVVHPANRGVCPARNTGIDQARGDWIVFLDSDDELAGPDALSRMAAHADAAPDGLHALWFRSRLDDGTLAPDPMPAAPDWDYAGYLRFLDETDGRPRDMIRCVRRTCFGTVRYPDSRMLEEGFHLDFARRFRSRLLPDVLRLYHQDAPNQLVRRLAARDLGRDRATCRDRAIGLDALLATHGEALARHAPRTHRALRARAAGQAIHAGEPAIARRWASRAFLSAPYDPRALGLLACAWVVREAAGRCPAPRQTRGVWIP